MFIPKIFQFNPDFGSEIEKEMQAFASSRSSRIGDNWITIAENLEISLEISQKIFEPYSYWKNWPKLAIRNKSQTILDEVIFYFQASNFFEGITLENSLTAVDYKQFVNVDSDLYISCLTSIPPIEFWILDENNVRFSFEELSVSLISITKNGEKKSYDRTLNLLSLNPSKNEVLCQQTK